MKERTPRSRIRSALRALWLRSAERSTALKNHKYTCICCGVKQSKAKGKEQKVEVHHKEGVLNWDEVLDEITDQLLCDPTYLEVLCTECHKKETKMAKEIKQYRQLHGV